MNVLGVLDLLGSRAVHARAGHRERYAPIGAVAGAAITPGDAVAVARAYVERLGVRDMYVADLDAIVHGRWQDALVTEVARVCPSIWLDAAVTTPEQARRALAIGASRVVVGLETLPSFSALERICDAVGGASVAFSLDLRDGVPITASESIPATEPAHLVAARAAAAGAGAIIVLDLARVGMGSGCDLALIARVRQAAPGVTLLAGGGVRGRDDLLRLAEAGCDGALVATALISGALGSG